MAYNDCLHITELAFADRASTLASTLSFNAYTGLETAERSLPAISYIAESAEPVVENQANRIVTMAVEIRTNMDDTTRAAHQDYVQQFLDLFFDDNLASELSAANTGFTCLGWEHAGEDQQFIDRSAVTTARLRLHVLPNDI